MMKFKFALSPLLAVFWFSACTNNDPIQARKDLLGPGDYGQILATTLTPLGSDTSLGKVVNTGLSFYLLAGDLDGTRSQFLMRFDKKALAGFQAVSGAFKRTQVILPIHLVVGEGQDYTPTIHRVTGAWEEQVVTTENFNDQIDGQTIGAPSFVSLDSLRKSDSVIDTVLFNIDSTYAKAWIADTSQHFGVAVRSESPDVLMEFFSRHGLSSVPRLKIVLARSTGKDTTLYANVAADAFIFSRTVTLPPERFYLGNGESFQTYLAFSLDSIPEESTINHAELQLTIDSTYTSNNSDGFAYVAYQVKAIENTDSLKFIIDDPNITGDDSQIAALGLISASDETFKVNLTAIVQRWRIAPESNRGILLQSTGPSRDLNRIAFFSQHSNTAQAPRLLIDYTVPPQ